MQVRFQTFLVTLEFSQGSNSEGQVIKIKQVASMQQHIIPLALLTVICLIYNSKVIIPTPYHISVSFSSINNQTIGCTL